MTTRLVTFLGKPGGPKGATYMEVQHTWDEKPGPKTPFAAVSLACALDLGHDDEVVVLATEEAWTCGPNENQILDLPHHGARLRSALVEAGRPVPTTPHPFLNRGDQPDDYWQHFDVLVQALQTSPNVDLVVLDITHSFRPHPMLAAAVVGYLRAIGHRMPELRVVYAAFDGVPRGQPVPIWDITPLVQLADWTWMLTLFLRSGRTHDAARVIRDLGRSERAAWARSGGEGAQPGLVPFATALESFGAALTTLRTGALLHGPNGAALRLLQALSDAEPEIVRSAPPLAPVMQQVREMVAPLICDDLASEHGDRAVAALARLYLGFERYLEAMATVREGWINRYAERDAIVPGGSKLGSDTREGGAKNRWFVAQPDIAAAVTGKRNDLLHAGYVSGGSMVGGNVPTAVAQEVERFRPAGTSEDAAGPAFGAFINLSAHPSHGWSDAQRAAAGVLGEPLFDVPFPEVDPNADLPDVEELAERTIASVPQGATVAMVMGESVLATTLVARLQARGVRCVAATTRREVALEADGTKRSRFSFVRFRDYPAVGG